jgi:hypothetical protein
MIVHILLWYGNDNILAIFIYLIQNQHLIHAEIVTKFLGRNIEGNLLII